MSYLARLALLDSGVWVRGGLIFSFFDSIRFMRVDALSLLLCLGNVTANVDVLVVDMVGGILTGAIAERLGGMFVCSSL